MPKLLQCEYEAPVGFVNLRNRLKETNIQPEALSLLLSMLKFDPKERITCKDALSSPYFADCFKKDFNETYRRTFESSTFFNSELKSSEPKKQ
jgi:serine/threonine protein kinase